MLPDQVLKTVQQHQLFQQDTCVFLALSGGADSVALFHVLREAGYRLHLMHANFQLRGEASDQDEQFVRELAKQYHVPIDVQRFDTTAYVAANKMSIETAARELRYAWFQSVLDAYQQAHPQEPAPVLATAHHQQDQAETVLHHLVRGAGLRGLGGMRVQQERIVRPLLFCTREAIVDYLERNNWSWREDQSNQDIQFTRNFLRHQVIPLLTLRFPQAVDQLAHTANILQSSQQLLTQLVQQKAQRWWTTYPSGEQGYPVGRLKSLQPQEAWLWELFRPFGIAPAQRKELSQLLDAQTGKYILTPTHRILRNRNALLVLPLETLATQPQVIESFTGKANTVSFTLAFSVHDYLPTSQIPTDPNVVWLDASAITLPLLVRPTKTGDYFYPLGLNKKKKISRFLTDLKLSRAAKEQTWVIESNQRIVWVCGLRLDHRARVQPHTKQVLQIQLTPAK